MLFLILAHRHFMRFLNEYVHSHECGIGQQPGINTLIGLTAYYLSFYVLAVGVYAESLAGFVLERCGTHELSDAYVHV